MENGENAASLLVYHRDRLNKLRSGISLVLGAFAEVLEERGALASGEPADVSGNLQAIEENSWSRIREHFLDGHSPSDGLQDGRGLARLLLDFTEKLDDVKDALEERLRDLINQKDSQLQQEVKDLQKKLAEEKSKASDLMWKHQELAETSTSEKHYKNVLQQQLKEKQEIIAQLQRNGTVQLWEKEKNKLLEGSRQHEENLTRDLTQLRETHEDMKDRLQRRIKDLEDKLKLERMKDVVSKIASLEGMEANVESQKRLLYSKDVEIARLEQELINQQRLIVGCVKGIQRDFRVMGERQEGRRLRKDDMQKMNAILDAILSGAREARLDITKADLPLHYISLPEDIVAHPGRKVSRSSVLAPVINRHLEVIGDSPRSSPVNNNSPPGSPKLPRRVPSLGLSTHNSSPALSLPSRSTTAMPSIDTGNGRTAAAKRAAPSGKAKISIDEGLIPTSPRGPGAKSPNPNTNHSGCSPGLDRKSRTTSVSDLARSPSLQKRRTVSTPAPFDLSTSRHRLVISPRDQALVVPRQPSGSPRPGGGRMPSSPARKPRGAGKLQAGNGSLSLDADAKDDAVAPDENAAKYVTQKAKSTLSGSGELALDKGANRTRNSARLNITEHPDLVDGETGILDIVTARECFPHMTEDQIKEHFSQFKKYDTNGDHCLDFIEMTQAIQSTVADYYKPRQIKEAMVEIDVDQSGSVDFYEYLGISTMLLMKVGKSEIFRSSMVKNAGGSISKVCSIQ